LSETADAPTNVGALHVSAPSNVMGSNGHRVGQRVARRTLLIIAALGAAPALAAAQRTSASSSPGRFFSRLSLDVLATGRKLPGSVLGEHVWGGGATVGLEFRPIEMVGLTVGAMAASTPQLNFKDHAMLNEVTPMVGLTWHAGEFSGWQPYAITGMAWQRFKVEEPPTNVAPSTTYAATHLGAGVMHDLTRFVSWKTELNAQIASGRTSYGMATGLAVRLSGARPALRRAVDTLIVRDTMIVRDTVVMTKRTVVTDTLVVHDTVVVERPKEVTRVVRGEDVILTLKDANFDFALARLRPEAYPVLDGLVAQLRERPIRILVVGHTDAVGRDEANMTLGQYRANAVRDYLVRRGVPADRIETDSNGERQPIATNETAAGRQLNRRVVISRIP
jgi:outer membrane protein OmpA-like peptidoglycan-associated protein